MSRNGNQSNGGAGGFPRVSGDEPGGLNGSLDLAAFSPRERG